MDITLKNYTTGLSKDILLLAKKNKVRECDEVKKGSFVAYVDEGNESYDVSLEIGAGGKTTGHRCDCGNPIAFCRHKTALLLHIAAGAKATSAAGARTAKANKKESKTEALLNNAGSEELREWVRGLVTKNKDIELSFIHHFSVKEQPTPVDVVRTTNEGIKAVIGNKKAIDATQLKKLVELWGEMHFPMVVHYRTNPTDEKSFLNFHTMLDSCMTFYYRFPTSSNKVLKFVETALQGSLECVANLYSEDAWDTAVSLFVSHIRDGSANEIRTYYLAHLKNLMDVAAADRKRKLTGWLAKQFGDSKPISLYNGDAYQQFIFDLVVDQNRFTEYYNLFSPIRFKNEYNLELIDLLIGDNHLDLAKKYCADQVKSNYQEQYNIPYLQRLKQILTIQKDEENLVPVLADLFLQTFDFEDYLFVSARLGEEERKKWRSKMLTRARNASHGRNKLAMEFCFKLADHDRNYKKMIEYIDGYTPYPMILRYFEGMVQADKNKLLETLVQKSDYDWERSVENDEAEAMAFSGLFALAEKYYKADLLKAIIKKAESKDRWLYRPLNDFMKYVKGRLG